MQKKYEVLHGLEVDLARQENDREHQDEFNAVQEAIFTQERELLAQSSGLAETAKERRRIELQILDLALREAREKFARLERESTDFRAIEVAREELKGLEARQPGAIKGALASTAGPLEQYLKGVPNTAAKTEEAIQSIKVNALDGLVQGLTDAATGAAKLGDVFKNVAKQIIADLIKIAIQKAIVGVLGKALGLPELPKLAGGGAFTILGRGGVDRNVMSLNGLPIARVSRGERVNVSNDNANASGGAGRLQIVPSPYFNVVVDGRASRIASPMASQASVAGAAAGQAGIYRRAQRRIP